MRLSARGPLTPGDRFWGCLEPAAETVTYTYDNADRLTDVSRNGADAGLNGTLHHGYDDASQITTRTYPDATATSAQFDDGRIRTLASGGATTMCDYNAAGNLTTVTLRRETATLRRAPTITPAV